jgi:hypothetical protein
MSCENCGTPEDDFVIYDDYARCPRCGTCYCLEVSA